MPWLDEDVKDVEIKNDREKVQQLGMMRKLSDQNTSLEKKVENSR